MTRLPNNAGQSKAATDPSRYEEFIQLIGSNQGRVFSYLLTLLSNYSDAEEVMQRTSVVLWRKFDEFEPSGDFARWACGVARFEMMTFLRLQNRERLIFDERVLEK